LLVGWLPVGTIELGEIGDPARLENAPEISRFF
jgi:hypothetical protein